MAEMTCQEVVELVTAYLDGALDVRTRQRFEEHLAGCVGCQAYLDQIERTISGLAHLPGATLPGSARDALLAALRARNTEASSHEA
jgi:anti-sigma factor RsiW